MPTQQENPLSQTKAKNPADTIPPIITVYRPTWSDHLLAIGFLIYAAAFSTLAIIAIFRIFS